MCGIAGYIGKRDIKQESVEDCLGLMRRRGPDSTGVYRYTFSQNSKVCLLHSRLSIIDLNERARQPFRSGQKVLVFNGELYNYVEIKAELEAKGIAFVTESDTEVLLKVLDIYGWQGLDRCEGMWAFAQYDESTGTLLFSRDRFGEKPLYFFEDETGFYFGSEVKFISALSGRRFEINYDHLFLYIVNGYKALYKKPATFFREVAEIKPSTVLSVYGDGTSCEEKYWKPVFKVDKNMEYEDAVLGARNRLNSAVSLRLRSDVPLAFCMSGGVDSNSLLSIAKRVFDYDVHGFTIVNTDERYAENDLVEYAVAELGIKHTSIPVNTIGFLDKLRGLIRYHDAPVYTISYYAHWLLMESIAEHGYRISISGTAADELFTGYYDHHNMYLYEVRNDRDLFDVSINNWEKYIKPIVRNPFLQDPFSFIKNTGLREHIFLDAEDYASYLTSGFYEKFTETRYCDGLLRNRMLNEMFNESVPVILHEDDLNAMFYSIENRSPFLDRHLFEFCYSVPTRHLIRDGYNKKVLRDAMKGIVPEKILNTRRKIGFNAPIFSFLDVHKPEVRSSLLDNSEIFEYISRENVEELISRSNLSNSESKFLFNFLCAKIFLEEFLCI